MVHGGLKAALELESPGLARDWFPSKTTEALPNPSENPPGTQGPLSPGAPAAAPALPAARGRGRARGGGPRGPRPAEGEEGKVEEEAL